MNDDLYTKRKGENWIEYHERIEAHNLGGPVSYDKPTRLDFLQADKDKETFERRYGN